MSIEQSDGTDGTRDLDPEELFGLLSNETRLSILRALEDGDELTGFADLHATSGIDDSGNFAYHLEKLVGPLVSRGEDGYALTPAGERVLRAIDPAASRIEPPALPATIDDQCGRCGAALEVRYEGEQVVVRCPSCPGVARGPGLPTGTYLAVELPTTVFAGRTATELARAAHRYYMAKLDPMLEGICPECGGEVGPAVSVCADHESDDVCRNCGWLTSVSARYTCPTCGYERSVLGWLPLLAENRVRTFLQPTDEPTSLPSQPAMWDVASIATEFTADLVSRDPVRIEATFPMPWGTLSVTADDTWTVREIEKRGAD